MCWSFSEGSSKVIVKIKNTHVDGKQEEEEKKRYWKWRRYNNYVEMGKKSKRFDRQSRKKI
jgi:hypothetical protein